MGRIRKRLRQALNQGWLSAARWNQEAETDPRNRYSFSVQILASVASTPRRLWRWVTRYE